MWFQLTRDLTKYNQISSFEMEFDKNPFDVSYDVSKA